MNKNRFFFSILHKIVITFAVIIITTLFSVGVNAVEGDPYIGKGTSAANVFTDIGFNPYDIAIDLNTKTAYLIRENDNMLYRVNLITGEMTYMEFSHETVSVALRDDKIYLAIANEETRDSGFIVTVDTATFTETAFFEIDKYPREIEVDTQGNAYISYRSGYSYYLASYEMATGTMLDYDETISIVSSMYYNSKYNRIYVVDMYLISNYHYEGYIFQLNNGMISTPYSAAGNNILDTSFIMMTRDNNYIITSLGNIYSCDAVQSADMQYYDNMERCVDSSLDSMNDRLYTVLYNTMLTYEFSTLTVVSHFLSQDRYYRVFDVNGSLLFIQGDSYGKYFFT